METFYWTLTASIFLADLAIRVGFSLRVIMRKREASVTLAWLVVILMLPFVGAVIYLLLGKNRPGQKRAAMPPPTCPWTKNGSPASTSASSLTGTVPTQPCWWGLL